MPKKVYDSFLRSLRRDIATNYNEGDRYLTVREIAEHFSVSLQTAQKGVSELKRDGLITSKQNQGIMIKEKNHIHSSLKGKKIIVVSNKQDGHFFSAFYDGAKEYASEFGIDDVIFLMNTFPETDTLAFGNYLASLDTDGLIMLSFPSSALPFYHVIREGIDIVSDIIIDELPSLPAIQTDNFKHAYEAGRDLIAKGCRNFYMFGYYKKDNKRYQGFDKAVREAGYTSHYIQISSLTGISETGEILMDYTDDTGLFIGDYSSAYVLDSLCARQKLTPENILVYDTDEEYFKASYLPPIRAIGPSLKTLGRELCALLLSKWTEGSYPQPLQRKI